MTHNLTNAILVARIHAMKRIILLTLFIIFALLLVACGGEEPAPAPPPPTADVPSAVDAGVEDAETAVVTFVQNWLSGG